MVVACVQGVSFNPTATIDYDNFGVEGRIAHVSNFPAVLFRAIGLPVKWPSPVLFLGFGAADRT